MPETITQSLDESLSSEQKALRVAAASMAERRAKSAATSEPSEEGTPELTTTSRRDATISKVDEEMSKQADAINPTHTNDGGGLDNVETVDVTDEVPVTNITDYNADQHSVDNAKENQDSVLDLPKPANTEGGDSINFLPGKSSKTASFSQILHLTDLYKSAGLLPEGDDRYAKISSLENLDISIVEDRISLLQEIVAVNSTKEASVPAVQRVAAVRPAPKVENATAPAMGRITQSAVSNNESLLFFK
jgi:hypothetical protein